MSARRSLLTLLVGLVGCASGSGQKDAGMDGGNDRTPCIHDIQCQPPQTCQDDGYCDYIPGLDDNKANGTFDLEMGGQDIATAVVLVSGKFRGKYLYMDYGGLVEFVEASNQVVMQLFGILSNTLLNVLVIQVPGDSPLDETIHFGVGGKASGTLDRVELDNDGYEVGRASVAEIVSGYVAFGSFGTGTGQRIKGTLEVEFRPVP